MWFVLRYCLLLLGLTFYSHWSFCATITGVVVDGSNQPIVGAVVEVGKVKATTNIKGLYVLNIQDAPIYQLSFSKVGFFSIIHSFSHNELAQTDFNLADVSLVNHKPGRVRLAFAGDVMMGRRYSQPILNEPVLLGDDLALQTKQIVSDVKPYISLADFASVNLETPIADSLSNKALTKIVTLFSPVETLSALAWAGVDYVSLGNNHIYDYGEQGLKQSIDFLNKSPLHYSGAGLNEKLALQPYVQKLANNDYGMLAYVGWQGRYEVSQTASKIKGGAAFGSLQNIKRSVRQAKHKGYVPVVQYHGSKEYTPEPSKETEQRLKTAIDAGAALAIGHHPHVTQGFELYKDKLIAWSLGNFVFDQYFYTTHYSMLVYVWMDGDKFHRAEIVPLYIKGYKPTPAVGLSRHTIMKRLIALSDKRNTFITRSGGHGVIAQYNQQPKKHKLEFKPNHNAVVSLAHHPWQQRIGQINFDKPSNYRLGFNLIPGSDGESFSSFETQERGWMVDKMANVVNFDGNNYWQLDVHHQPSRFGMQYFARMFKPETAMSVVAQVKTSNPVVVKVYWQGRKRGQGITEAMTDSPKHLIATFELDGSSQWQSLQADFNAPDASFRGLRAFVTVESKTKTLFAIDNFEFINWQTPFVDDLSVVEEVILHSATHLQFEGKSDSN